MPYITEGPSGEVAFSSLGRHLLGTKGPTGFSSKSTAAEVSKDWNGEGKVRRTDVAEMKSLSCIIILFRFTWLNRGSVLYA
jgi:hypothetical protein